MANAGVEGHNLFDGAEPSLDSDATFNADTFSFPHGTHLCAMEVDTETGATRMRKYVAVDDIGTIINPLIVEGQEHGGILQGVAQALWEEAEFDASGTLVTGSFVDYTLPTAADTINFVTDNTVTPATTNTLGTKGVGEAGCIASTRPSSMPSWTPSGTSASTTSRCRSRRAGVERRPVGRHRPGWPVAGAQPHFAEGALNQDPSAGATDGAAQ